MTPTIYFLGPSGVFKTQLAALAQQFFGPEFTSSGLPGAWSSTDNSLENTLFCLKEAVCVIDDFAAHGGPSDVQKLNAKADRIIRSVGNGSARGRMNADGTARPTKISRALPLVTGEDAPSGHSLRARTFFVDVGPGDVDREQLTLCQRDAGEGSCSLVLAGYLQYQASRLEEVQRSLRTRIAEYRAQIQSNHNRTPEIVANLMIGIEELMGFGIHCGVIDVEEAAKLSKEALDCFQKLAARQEVYQSAASPADRFIELLSAAVASGECHVAGRSGQVPPRP
jgi:DNA polymerase III delta prime subunit